MADDAVDVELRGLPELAAGTLVLAGRIEEAAPRALLDPAGKAGTIARGRVPRQTGRLASSVHTGVSRDAAWVGFGDGVPYAGWIEFGGTRGRPYVSQGRYLYPAAQAVEQQVQLAGERAAEQEIGGMHWPSP